MEKRRLTETTGMRAAASNLDGPQSLVFDANAGVTSAEFYEWSPPCADDTLFTCAVFSRKGDASDILNVRMSLSQSMQECCKRVFSLADEDNIEAKREGPCCVSRCMGAPCHKQNLFAPIC